MSPDNDFTPDADVALPDSGSVLARLRLVRRARRSLADLLDAQVELFADVENAALPLDASAPRLLRTDLMVRVLDLRIRICVIPQRGPDALDEISLRNAAFELLAKHADTASLVLVVDDKDLTAELVEPFDAPDAHEAGTQSPVDSLAGQRRPLGDLVRSYLGQVNPDWPRLDYVVDAAADLPALANTAATASMDALQERAKRRPESRAARESLDMQDAAFIAELATRIMSGGLSDPAAEIASQARRKRGSV